MGCPFSELSPNRQCRQTKRHSSHRTGHSSIQPNCFPVQRGRQRPFPMPLCCIRSEYIRHGQSVCVNGSPASTIGYGKTLRTLARQSAPPFLLARGDAGEGCQQVVMSMFIPFNAFFARPSANRPTPIT